MTEKQYSAEKDLLKLIENPGTIEPNKPVFLGGKLVNQKPVKKISFFSRMKSGHAAGEAKKSLNLRTLLTDRRMVLRLLFLVTVGFLIYFVATIAQESFKVRNTKNLVKFTDNSQGKDAGPSALKGLESKLAGSAAPEGNGVDFRNIFIPGFAKKEEEKKDEGTAALGDYRLVGISLGVDPKETYAMIKNAKTNITYFLKKGESLDGMELLEILDNKLALKVRGKVAELR